MTWYDKDLKETDITRLNQTFTQLGFDVVVETFVSQGWIKEIHHVSKVSYKGEEFAQYEERMIVLYHGIVNGFPQHVKQKIKTALSDPKIRLEDRV